MGGHLLKLKYHVPGKPKPYKTNIVKRWNVSQVTWFCRQSVDHGICTKRGD